MKCNGGENDAQPELRTLTTLAKRSPDWLMQLKATRDGFTEGLDTLDLRRADGVLARA